MRRDVALSLQNDSLWYPGILAIVVILIACLSSGCVETTSDEEDGRIPVAVTILPMKEIASAIGGDRIAVTVIVPPGTEPHTFEPTPGQIVSIAESRIFFRVGCGLLPFEDRLVSRLSSQNPGLLVVDLSEGIDLIKGDAGHEHDENHLSTESADPHIWLSPTNGALMAETIARTLIAIDPEGEAIYQENLDEYQKRTASVDAEVREILGALPGRRFIVTHDAWGYFAREYDLEQVAVHIGGKEPTAREIQEVVRIAVEDGIRIVCIEPQFPERSARVIAAEINGDVVVIDPLPEAYLENFIRVAEALQGGHR